MKLHIGYQLKEGAWGGGNQFLNALKKTLIKQGTYTESLAEADGILFNSYQNLSEALQTNRNYPSKKIIFRLGPIFHLHRGERWKTIDKLVIEVVNMIADLAIFQSEWSYQEALKLGLQSRVPYTIIGNAVDSEIFNTMNRAPFNSKSIKLIATSWSKNWNKGFEYYQFLDTHLDFNHYQMTFIGNSPISFEHIENAGPLPNSTIAQKLKDHDFFISAVKDDANSNSIVEALASGLPVIALDSGANKEIIGQGGEFFTTTEELLEKIILVSNHYSHYQQAIKISTIEERTKQYLEAIETVAKPASAQNSLRLLLLSLKIKTTLLSIKVTDKFLKPHHA